MKQYKIVPSVLDDGTPAWVLLVEWDGFGFAGTKQMAKNTDRKVLERAVEHLRQPDSATDAL